MTPFSRTDSSVGFVVGLFGWWKLTNRGEPEAMCSRCQSLAERWLISQLREAEAGL